MIYLFHLKFKCKNNNENIIAWAKKVSTLASRYLTGDFINFLNIDAKMRGHTSLQQFHNHQLFNTESQ